MTKKAQERPLGTLPRYELSDKSRSRIREKYSFDGSYSGVEDPQKLPFGLGNQHYARSLALHADSLN